MDNSYSPELAVRELIHAISQYALKKGESWRLGEGAELMDALNAVTTQNVIALVPAPRRLKVHDDVFQLGTWNASYTTGTYFVSKDEVSEEEVNKFANEHVHFPFWPLQYLGKLWAKDTWDD